MTDLILNGTDEIQEQLSQERRSFSEKHKTQDKSRLGGPHDTAQHGSHSNLTQSLSSSSSSSSSSSRPIASSESSSAFQSKSKTMFPEVITLSKPPSEADMGDFLSRLMKREFD
jgi:hypothetical protein